MVEYKIGFGLGGGYGGIADHEIHGCATEDDAQSLGRELAIDYYQMYEGMGGLPSWDCCRQEYIDEYEEEPDDDIVNDMYNEEIETWIVFEVEVWDGEEIE